MTRSFGTMMASSGFSTARGGRGAPAREARLGTRRHALERCGCETRVEVERGRATGARGDARHDAVDISGARATDAEMSERRGERCGAQPRARAAVARRSQRAARRRQHCPISFAAASINSDVTAGDDE